MAVLSIGTGVSIMVGTAEYADETTEYELGYEEKSSDPVPFLDGHAETPAGGGRSWKLKLKGARDETAGSLFDFLWITDGQSASFTIADQGAEYLFDALVKPAPLASTAGEANMFEVELPVTSDPVRTGKPPA